MRTARQKNQIILNSQKYNGFTLELAVVSRYANSRLLHVDKNTCEVTDRYEAGIMLGILRDHY